MIKSLCLVSPENHHVPAARFATHMREKYDKSDEGYLNAYWGARWQLTFGLLIGYEIQAMYDVDPKNDTYGREYDFLLSNKLKLDTKCWGVGNRLVKKVDDSVMYVWGHSADLAVKRPPTLSSVTFDFEGGAMGYYHKPSMHTNTIDYKILSDRFLNDARWVLDCIMSE